MWARLAALAALARRALPEPSDPTCPSIRIDGRFDCADVHCTDDKLDDAIEKNCVCCCDVPPRGGPNPFYKIPCAFKAPCCAADTIPALKCEAGGCENYPDGLLRVTGVDVEPGTCSDDKGEFSGAQPGHWFTAACPPGYDASGGC